MFISTWAALRIRSSAVADIIKRGIALWCKTIPRCDNESYTDENLQIFDFTLSLEEMEKINGLNKNERTYEKNDPDNFPW